MGSLALQSASPTSLAILGGGFDATTKQARLQYAKILLSEVESIDSAIPNLSPDEVNWLKSERERIAKLREDPAWATNLAKLCATKEYKLEDVKRAFGNLRTVLQSFEKAASGEAAWKQSAEASAWVAVAWQLSEPDLFINLEWLRKNGTLSLPKSAADSSLSSELHANIARDILTRIVLPILNELTSNLKQ